MTTTDQHAVTLRISAVWPWLLRIGLPIVGFGLGFVVAPLVRWLLSTVDAAPGLLRILAQLPTGWAVLVTTLIGVCVGLWLAHETRHEALLLTVDHDHVLLAQEGEERYLGRDRIDAVFRDGSDLVLLDAGTTELARNKASDLAWNQVQEAFERFDYPWRGSADPFDAQFRRWVDGHPDLDATAHGLLRRRARALKDERSGEAGDALDQLRDRGIVVRDRDGAQQYRLAATRP
ncbi:MAG: hypothetical protein L0I76_27495 [Pseudonocardia sp.]|nr:hypothetical protein [Pseudonocardia sp.]